MIKKKEDEIGRACRAHDEDKQCVKRLGLKQTYNSLGLFGISCLYFVVYDTISDSNYTSLNDNIIN